MKYIIGVDPGLSGAIAVFKLDPDLQLVGIRDMPVQAALKGKGRTVDCIELARLFRPFSQQEVLCFIEAVNSMPNQGVASSFKFGRVSMAPEAIAHAYRYRVDMISPHVWKRKAKLIKKPKDASLALAKSMFPEHEHLFRLKKHEGRAEAALIAYFGIKLMED